jgi:dTDP-4-dehydrorhamnose 3,5-epimerase
MVSIVSSVRISRLRLPEVLLLETEPEQDPRGSFARWWDADLLSSSGADPHIDQISVSTNRLHGTLRGIHIQEPPFSEAKTVRCIRGAAWDVAVDLRVESPTRYEWVAVELSAANGRGLHIPRGFGHGFLTLDDDSSLLYIISTRHHPAAVRGHRWDDPIIGIDWPVPVVVISDRDRSWPLILQS